MSTKTATGLRPSTRLLSLHYSPWSEKARFALDHHHVAYREQSHVPMLGEPLLRLRVRRLFGKVSVPVLFHSHEIFEGSYAIARHAEAIGSGSTLFPGDQLDAIRVWNDRSDAIMEAGRPLVVAKTLRSPDALREGLPSFVPVPLRSMSWVAGFGGGEPPTWVAGFGGGEPPTWVAGFGGGEPLTWVAGFGGGEPLTWIAKIGAHFLARKYGADLASEDRYRETIAQALEVLRDGLRSSRPYLLGKFTYADIAMAAALQFVRPVADEHLRLGPATRAAWTQDELARRFEDLLAWRDEIYATNRRT